jgi:hypothetical protein
MSVKCLLPGCRKSSKKGPFCSRKHEQAWLNKNITGVAFFLCKAMQGMARSALCDMFDSAKYKDCGRAQYEQKKSV